MISVLQQAFIEFLRSSGIRHIELCVRSYRKLVNSRRSIITNKEQKGRKRGGKQGRKEEREEEKKEIDRKTKWVHNGNF